MNDDAATSETRWLTPAVLWHLGWLVAIAVAMYQLRHQLTPAALEQDSVTNGPLSAFAVFWGYVVYALTTSWPVIAGSEWVNNGRRVALVHLATLLLAGGVIGGAVAFVSLSAS